MLSADSDHNSQPFQCPALREAQTKPKQTIPSFFPDIPV